MKKNKLEVTLQSLKIMQRLEAENTRFLLAIVDFREDNSKVKLRRVIGEQMHTMVSELFHEADSIGRS